MGSKIEGMRKRGDIRERERDPREGGRKLKKGICFCFF